MIPQRGSSAWMNWAYRELGLPNRVEMFSEWHLEQFNVILRHAGAEEVFVGASLPVVMATIEQIVERCRIKSVEWTPDCGLCGWQGASLTISLDAPIQASLTCPRCFVMLPVQELRDKVQRIFHPEYFSESVTT